MEKAGLFWIVFSVLFSQGQSTDCDECADYLISGPRGIVDDKLTASSTHRSGARYLYHPKYSRLHFYQRGNPSAGGWSAATNNDQQYIQAEFSTLKVVKSILTQGRYNHKQWVTSYSISYSIDGLIWSTVNDVNGSTMIYPANNDRSSVVTNALPNCLETKYIRLHPVSWFGYVSLRFDVIGCSKLDTKIPRDKMNWKRAPIIMSPEVQKSLTQAFETSTNSINVCAVKCQQSSLCLSFKLSRVSGTCTGFQEHIYQGDRTSFSSRSDDAYFISSSQLENYEYKILDSLNLFYKIFTLKATAGLAHTLCKKEGTGLLSIRNLDEMNAIQKNIKSNLILSQESHYYVDGSYRNGLWKYATDKEIPASLLSPSNPLLQTGGCITLTLNGLATHNCMDSLYFICGI